MVLTLLLTSQTRRKITWICLMDYELVSLTFPHY